MYLFFFKFEIMLYILFMYFWGFDENAVLVVCVEQAARQNVLILKIGANVSCAIGDLAFIVLQ